MRGERLQPGQRGTINTAKSRNGKWRADCYYRDPTGTRKRITRTGTSQAEAARKLGLALSKGPQASITTVEDLLVEWLKRHDTISQATRERYQDCLTRHLIPSVGDIRVEDLSTPLVDEALRTIYIDHSRFAAGRARSLLRMACKWGTRNGIVERDFTAEVPIPGKKARTRPWVPTDQQITLLLRLLREEYEQAGRSGPISPSAWIAAELMATTGGRIGEVCAARWENIDWEKGTLTYFDTVVFEDGKNKMRGHLKNHDPQRTVYLPLPTLHLLRKHRKEEGFITSARGGVAMTTANMRRTWRRVYDRAGVPKDQRIRPHDLRRSVGTKVTNALGIDAASAQLGDTRKITERHYASPTYEGPQAVRDLFS